MGAPVRETHRPALHGLPSILTPTRAEFYKVGFQHLPNDQRISSLWAANGVLTA